MLSYIDRDDIANLVILISYVVTKKIAAFIRVKAPDNNAHTRDLTHFDKSKVHKTTRITSQE